MFSSVVVIICVIVVSTFIQSGHSFYIDDSNINWANLTSSELSELDPLVFVNVTAEEINMIPPMACDGFTNLQILNLNDTATAGFTYACLERMSSNATMFFNPVQIRNLEGRACKGFTSTQLLTLNTVAFKGFTDQCISNFSVSGCNGINIELILLFNMEQFQGFTFSCISNWKVMINDLNITQISWFSDDQLKEFTYPFVMKISPQSLTLFSISQLAIFSSDVISNLTSDQLWQLYITKNTSLLSGITYPYFDTININTIQYIKAMLNNYTYQYLLYNDTLLQNLSHVNWLIVSSIKDEDFKQLITENNTNIGNIREEGIAGLRTQQVTLLPPYIFSRLLSNQANYLLPDTIANMSISQYQALTPSAISGINPNYIGSINPNVFNALSCPQMVAFTDAQKQTLNNIDSYRIQVGMHLTI